MPIDTTPSTVATNALQAIPFKSLIGGPLQACVEAQAHAATTSLSFIEKVGLSQPDPKGNRTATTVVFQYQKAGEMVNLVVPLLAIVPIPYIAIDDVSIDFKANISASSSSVSSQTESTTAGGSATGSLRAGWGPFAFQTGFNANYSSKKDSRSSQDSRYSVEYTMDVRVHAGQSDMPSGLARVLNLLESAITEGNPTGGFEVSPRLGRLDLNEMSLRQEVLAVVKDPKGLLLKEQKVEFSVDSTVADTFTVATSKGKGGSWSSGKITVSTDAKGQAGIWLQIAENKIPPSIAEFKVTLPGHEQEKVVLQTANVSAKPLPPPTLDLDPSGPTINLTKSQDNLLKATVKMGTQPVQDRLVAFTVTTTDPTKLQVGAKEGTLESAWTNGTIKVKTSQQGIASIAIKPANDADASKIKVSVVGTSVEKQINVSVV